MQRKFLPLAAGAFFLAVFSIISCNKLDTTDIGSGLIPPVDNVTTFDTILNVTTTQGIFNDSTIMAVADDHVIGSINNDPVFGQTNAALFLQLKPTFFKYYWGSANDTVTGPGLGLDSVVLCLRYKGFYGDTSKPQKLSVLQIASNSGFKDSAYRVGQFYPALLPTVLGSATIDPTKTGTGFKMNNKRDSVYSQIRIKITNSAFINTLFSRDSTANNAFASDSLFKTFYNGFAIVADSAAGNGLFYCNLNDTLTRLEVHYKAKKAGNGGKIDSVFSSFLFNTTSTSINSYSARANYVVRKRAGAEISSPLSSAVYIQSTPGTYAEITIPGLSTLSNRIIHRAELIMEQVPDPLMTVMSPPSYLYLDAVDTTTTPRWLPIPYDLSPNENYNFYPGSGGIDFTYFGGFERRKNDIFGNGIAYYNFNLSRYVQHIVTNHNLSYKLRLYAPFQLYYNEFIFGPVSFANSLGFGRVKLGSGTNANYKMRLHIIYSKI